LNILKIKEKLLSLSKKKKELINVVNFSNSAISIKSTAFNFNSQVHDEFEKLYHASDVENSIFRLFDGEKINTSEEKAALHWQARDPNSDIYKNIFKISKKIKYRIGKDSIKNIVTLSIGGSFEGPKLLLESLASPKNKSHNHLFITGSDNQEFNEKLLNLIQKETIFILTSKSMKSTEVINNFKLAKKWLSSKLNNEEVLSKFYCVTSNVSKAEKLGIHKENIIFLNDEIGGRFSIWSEVSLLSIIESEKTFASFLAGGHAADLEIKSKKRYKKTIKKLSYIDLWNSNFLDINNRVILSYAWKLRSFPKYIQQLEMESLGKKANLDSIFEKTSQTIYGDYGPRAQHSFFQMLHQGTSNTCIDFILNNEDSKSNKLTKIQALTQNKLFNSIKNKRGSVTNTLSSNLYSLKGLSPFNLGFLISSWEHKTFITSQLLMVNPFDQFGVEEGKIIIDKKFNY
tara:strand:+ start:1013 stop:2386 length:1374 start_codon:yes stop_codon:yes gene_type:complete